MNYSELIQLLDEASAFDLYRLRAALDNMIDDPRRIIEVKAALRMGQRVVYFDASENKALEAIVEQIKQTRAVVRNLHDGKRWSIPLSSINVRESDITIEEPKKKGLTKNELQVGDIVGFVDRSGIERSGEVVRLNQKTVTIESDQGGWRVSYGLLHKVIDQTEVTASSEPYSTVVASKAPDPSEK